MSLDVSPLNSEETASLLAILRYLRTERKLKYSHIAKTIGIDVADIFLVTSQRGPGSADIFNKVKYFCKENQVDYNEIIERNKIGSNFLISEIGINEDIVNNSEKEMAGSYLLFSAGANLQRAVTLVVFSESDKKTPLSRFQARRPRKSATDLKYGGFYHKYYDTVFMYGHIDASPLARSIMLVPLFMKGLQPRWKGFMIGASETDMLFMSSCMMKRIDDSDEIEKIIGDYDYNAFNRDFSDVERILQEVSDVKSISRVGG